jgi:hypothetical protein
MVISPRLPVEWGRSPNEKEVRVGLVDRNGLDASSDQGTSEGTTCQHQQYTLLFVNTQTTKHNPFIVPELSLLFKRGLLARLADCNIPRINCLAGFSRVCAGLDRQVQV